MLHLRLHNARNFKKNAPTGSQKRAAATPFMTKTVAAANSKLYSGARPRGQILVLGSGPEIKYLLET